MTALSVFLGTLPLLLTVAWGMYENVRRLARIEARLDHLERQLDSIDAKLSSLNGRLVRMETKVQP